MRNFWGRDESHGSAMSAPRMIAPIAPLSALISIRLTVNGDALVVATSPNRTLLELLRYDIDLTGTKQGCDKGDCGACTVLIDGRPALACLTLAQNCDNRSIATVESLKGAPDVDPLLDAFDRTGAGQCGFCTPGMLMCAKALLHETPAPSRDAIREAVSGNLCRCTGYGPIIDAIELAASKQASTSYDTQDSEFDHLPTPLAGHGAKSP